MKKKCFGEVSAMIYVIEFQKRGLPHAHFLLILKPQFKIKCRADYDKFVSAEIPTLENPTLRKSVLAYMMHGPCSNLNPGCPCMRKKGQRSECKNGYPKKISDQTNTNKDGYPLYHRSNDGQTAKVRGHYLDNRWVVPYNPYLMTLFDCHINVEVCSTIKAVKYLYKYVYKGHDRIQYNVGDDRNVDIDEIQQYQSGRWVSPCEAAWRIFSFDLFEIYPSVLPLPVHLPNMQNVRLQPHERLQNVVRDNSCRKTTLTEFFKLNASIPGGSGYLYPEVCEHYRWDASSKSWIKRKLKLIQVGRVAFVYPSEGDRFYLRLLLQHVRSPTSFEDLRTVQGRVCNTFQEAVVLLGLIEHDNIAETCLIEASEVQLPVAFRKLFAMVLIFSDPSDPYRLWLKFYDQLSKDFTYKMPNDPVKARKYTIREVEQHLEAMGKTLLSIGLSELYSIGYEELRRTKDIIDALDAPIPEDCIECRNNLNTAQSNAFNLIMKYVHEEKGGAFFVDGPGGTGKTFLYKALYAELRLLNKIVLPTATSGIAASNIPSGRTAHSSFKIPLDMETSKISNISKQISLAALLKETTLIIWDEASMTNKDTIECLDLMLKDICSNTSLFGGKLVVFGGDFRQVLPIVPHKSQKEAVDASIVSSHLWPHFVKLQLTENQRAKDDPLFCRYLLALGNGELQTAEVAYVPLPEKVMIAFEKHEEVMHKLTEITFPEIYSNNFESSIFSDRAILTPVNETVDLVNSFLIEKYPGDSVIYKSFDSVINDTCDVYPTEFLNKLCPGGMSPHELVLKVDCPVILLRNLLPSVGLCNCTRLLCKAFSKNVIDCKIYVGQYKGDRVFIPRINLRPSSSIKYPFQFQRKQFPLKLSFAMTVNKSQGQTLERVCILLPQPCFSHGQLYVALSRARKKSNVTVFSLLSPSNICQDAVRNVVCYDVLSLAKM